MYRLLHREMLTPVFQLRDGIWGVNITWKEKRLYISRKLPVLVATQLVNNQL